MSHGEKKFLKVVALNPSICSK